MNNCKHEWTVESEVKDEDNRKTGVYIYVCKKCNERRIGEGKKKRKWVHIINGYLGILVVVLSLLFLGVMWL